MQVLQRWLGRGFLTSHRRRRLLEVFVRNLEAVLRSNRLAVSQPRTDNVHSPPLGRLRFASASEVLKQLWPRVLVPPAPASPTISARLIYTSFGEPASAAGTVGTRYLYAGAFGYESIADLDRGRNATGQPIPFPFLHVGARWYDPATDRAFRINRTRNVQVHKLLCIGALEERIDEMIERKKEVAEKVVGTGEAWLTELPTLDLKELFALRKEAVAW